MGKPSSHLVDQLPPEISECKNWIFCLPSHLFLENVSGKNQIWNDTKKPFSPIGPSDKEVSGRSDLGLADKGPTSGSVLSQSENQTFNGWTGVLIKGWFFSNVETLRILPKKSSDKIIYWLGRYSFLLDFMMSKKCERLSTELLVRIWNNKLFVLLDIQSCA